MKRTLSGRRGFSLIELLIVVAIIAALVGVAVPFFQDNLSEAQRTKAKQDLEIIKKSISLYDARESTPLTGTGLAPLLGRYMQELPKDPWGNDYLFDGRLGLLASYGADALPLGSGGDQDITVFTRPPVMITRVQYQGSWGRPRAMAMNTAGTSVKASTGNKFIVSFSKPFEILGGQDPTATIQLLTDTNNKTAATAGWPSGGSVLLDNSGSSWSGDVWVNPTQAGSGTADPLENPEVGSLVIHSNLTVSGSTDQSVTPTMALDLLPADDQGHAVETSIGETWYADPIGGTAPPSPLDSAVYGTDGEEYTRAPRVTPLVNGYRRGVRIEKY